ncbi:MAG: ABC-2 type transporter [Methanomassiliicoccales archaeon PtaU1.Bin124]|nr:MAG: ABC-2 type transporter [Methanomassiliicoccales archaeon PtaU1.Bin124]
MNYDLMLRGTLVTAKKDMMIYYRKAPVYIFGLILPTFLFFAFFVGRDLDMQKYFPGFLAMSLFFTASSVGPLIIPWEKQAGTFERLLSLPLNIPMLILGDSLAGAAFGLFISTIIFAFGSLLVGITAPIGLLILLPFFFIIGNVCFAAMGVLLSSPAGKVPANIMMLAALVRFPLIFISGVFVPLSEMTGAGQVVAYFSPLTYLVDGLNAALGQEAVIGAGWDLLALFLFTIIFLAGASYVLKRKAMKGL